MVKNKKGGSGHKKMANKMGDTHSKEIIIPHDKDEMFAIVLKNYGNGRSEVRCNDGKRRMLYIPRRFRGRNRIDNMVSPGALVLVGLRSWELRQGDKMPKCDLLYVYDESDVNRLKRSQTSIEWNILRTENSGMDFGDLGFDMVEDDNEMVFNFDEI